MALDSRPVHQSFVTIGRYRYALVPAVLAAACAGAYLLRSRVEQPSGGTWLGLTLGTIAAPAIAIQEVRRAVESGNRARARR